MLISLDFDEPCARFGQQNELRISIDRQAAILVKTADTSGVISVRWGAKAAYVSRNLPWNGYEKGAPVGGDLSKAPAGKAPTFLVAAVKDPQFGKLDRIQIVKGWLGKDGRRKRRCTRWPGATQRAFYYARAIEIPTPRWTAYDQLRFGIRMSTEVPMTQLERAWSSPIWYTP